MKRGLLILVVPFILAGLPRPAAASIAELYVQLDAVGFATGKRLGGLELAGETDFFKRNEGMLTGFKAGAEILNIDLFVDFKQAYGTDGWKSSWIAFLLGFDFDFGLLSDWHLILGVDAGFGLGTEGAIDPPITNDGISQKGLVAQARLALERRFVKVLAIGAEVDVGYHYLFLGGDAVANSDDSQVQGFHVLGMLYAKVALGI